MRRPLVSMTLRAVRLMAVVLLAVAGATLWPDAAHAETKTEVSFTSHGVTLHGTVLAPPSSGRKVPGMVLIGGSGPGTREDTRQEAEAFTKEGIATLIYDKRTVGYSATKRSFSLLADDALAAVGVLRARGDVDPNRIGLWGVSEGAWVAPLAASRSAQVDYVVLVAASGVSPSRQDAWEIENEVRYEGVSGRMPHDLPIAAIRLVEGLGMFPEANYAPVPPLERLHQPVLAIWGAKDKASPPAESLAIVRKALDKGGNHDYELQVFPDAEHVLHQSASGFDDPAATPFAPGYLEKIGSWVNGLPGHPHTSVGGPAATQDRMSASVEPDTWYEQRWPQLAALVLFVVVFAGYAVSAVIRRLAGRRGRPVVGWPARVLATAGLLVVLGTAGYVVTLLLLLSAGPVAGGVAVIWMVLRVLTIVAVAAAVVTAVAWWRHRKAVGGWAATRLGLLLLGGVVTVPWAMYWGLLPG